MQKTFHLFIYLFEPAEHDARFQKRLSGLNLPCDPESYHAVSVALAKLPKELASISKAFCSRFAPMGEDEVNSRWSELEVLGRVTRGKVRFLLRPDDTSGHLSPFDSSSRSRLISRERWRLKER